MPRKKPAVQKVQQIKEKFSTLEKNVQMAFIFVGIVFLWMLSGIFSSSDETVEATFVKPTKHVEVIQAKITPYVREVILSGTTEPFSLVNLAARTEGQIEEILADKGDSISATQILLKMEKEAREETVKAAELQLKLEQSLFKAAKSLNKQGYRATNSLDERRAALANAEQMLKSARNDLAFTEITSPIDGVIEDRHVEKGDYVKKGDTVYQIVSKDKYKVVAHVSQKDRGMLKVGAEASAKLATDETVNGIITFIASNAHPITHTYKVEMTIETSKTIPTGMSVKLNIPTEKTEALHIPYAAMILNDAGKLGTMIITEDDKALFKEINPLDDNGKGFFLTGLANDARVVVKGQTGLVDNEVVIPHLVTETPIAKKVF